MKIRGSVVSSSFVFPNPPEDRKIEKKKVVEKPWKELGGNQEDTLLSIEKFGGYKTEVK